MTRPALVTGFEAYGGRERNPAGEIAASLDGSVIGGNVWMTHSVPRYTRVTIESPNLQLHQTPTPELGDGI